jgi:GNAT superfamily N-acetyltransferase
MIELPKPFSHSGGNSIDVRCAESEDFEQVLALLSQMHLNDRVRSSDALAATFAAMVDSPSRALLVATEAGAVVGTLDLFAIENLTHGGRPWAGVENVVVDAGHRRRGIGGALMEAAIALATAAGCYKLQLVSHDRRDAAHGLYVAAGLDAPVRGYRRYL